MPGANSNQRSLIYRSNIILELETNGGPNVSNLQASFGNIKAWFNSTAIVNVLSHSLLADDSHHRSSIFACMANEGWIEFVRLGCGLHAHDVRNKLNYDKPKFINYSLAQNMDQNKNMCSAIKIQRADQVKNCM